MSPQTAQIVDVSEPVEQNPVAELVRYLRNHYSDCITGQLVIPAQAGRFESFPEDLDPKLCQALGKRGIQQLYSHQKEAWQIVQQDQNVVIATPTASGKSLCYHLPVLSAALKNRDKALYLFPTKALSQDQVSEILAISNAGDLGIKAFTFDGDTPSDARKAVRTRGDIVVSNPDMLHRGILPHHTKWAQFFEKLRYVVIDELHGYRGIFGSHVANVMRRLRRICRFYGSDPVFILCSATIGNPSELAENLIDQPVQTITESGAPQGERHLLLWNPPIINADLGIRAPARSQTARIARLAVDKGLKSIVFAQSRLMVEVLTKYLKDTYDDDPRIPEKVVSYRGGYLPKTRRKSERQLRQGNIECVVTTSALELGVDIGALDVCVLNGYPGSFAGTWQRLGRAGRRLKPSLGVLVAANFPLDQFIVRNPDFFLGNSPEQARIDPDQLLILLDHIRCAAFELPFQSGEQFGSEDLLEFLQYLRDEGVLHQEGGMWHWMTDAYPANSVSLRSTVEGNFVVIDIGEGRKDVLAEVDYSSAALTLYEGAIYLLQARPYQVERLDWEGRKAFVRATKADYYTDSIEYTRLKILEQFERSTRGERIQARGEVHLLRRISGYKKIRYYSHENVGYGNINLPDQELHTSAVWWQIPASDLHASFNTRQQALDGFLGAAYAMHQVASLLVMSEIHDLGRAVGDGEATWFATVGADGRGQTTNLTGKSIEPDHIRTFRPTVFLYDNHPGGSGLSPLIYQQGAMIVAQAKQLIGHCECLSGCPSCIGPILASDDSRGYSPKQAATKVLALLEPVSTELKPQ